MSHISVPERVAELLLEKTLEMPPNERVTLFCNSIQVKI